MERTIRGVKLRLKQGDITRENADALVNAANSSLMGGGGVDGAIHRAGGPSILAACRKIKEAKGSLPAGEAVITTGGDLKARYVIHTVGPVWRGGKEGEEAILKSCYRVSLSIAVREKLRSVAFPSISTGAYGYPVEEASRSALQSVAEFLEEHDTPRLKKITFVLFSEADLETYRRALEKL